MISQSIHLTRENKFELEVNPFLKPTNVSEPFVIVKINRFVLDMESKESLGFCMDFFISDPEAARRIAKTFMKAVCILEEHEAKKEAERVLARAAKGSD